ncbi:MAG TPA: RNase adapter RapZ [Thermoanaerobaculia bacterium]|nr:RNase adapter RapZ [Thermoanaerobaculia bacterium]
MEAQRCRLVIVTGLSGSGKSCAANCFEDLGYHVVENLPVPLLEPFLADPAGLVEGKDKIAVVTDVRASGFAERFPALIDRIDRSRVEVTLLFLEASDEALIRRFSETRRPHPLAQGGDLIDSIRRERQLLAELRGRADLVLDTSEWSIHETRRRILAEFATEPGDEPALAVSLTSFGFKHGIPYGSDLVFDVRFLPNPYFVPGLREQTGQDAQVRSYLEVLPEYAELLSRLTDLLLYLLPLYRRENRSYLTVAVGCTGGRHRSVAVAEALGKGLAAGGWPVRLAHRDLAR